MASDSDHHFKNWPNIAGFDAQIEHPKPITLTVKGHIPSIAAGTLYRTGPGTYLINGSDFKADHWFDGFAHVYRFDLAAQDDGSCTVTYRSRRTVDGLIEKARKTGRFDIVSFGQKRDPCEGIFKKLKMTLLPAIAKEPGFNNISVTVMPNFPGVGEDVSFPETRVGDKEKRIKNLISTTDHATLLKLDPETLEPLEHVWPSTIHPDLNGIFSAAHAQVDPETGDIFNFNLFVHGPRPIYRVYKTSVATGNTEILATMSASDLKAAYIHSMFMTSDYVVLAVWPSHLAKGGAQVVWERNVADAILPFSTDCKTQWLVVDRRHGRGCVARFEGPAAFSFHSINSWQEKSESNDNSVDVFCEVVEYQNLDIIHRFYYDNLTSTGSGAQDNAAPENESFHAHLVRYKLANVPRPDTIAQNQSQRAASSIKSQPVAIVKNLGHEMIGELPTFNERFATRKSRYIYSLIDRGQSSFIDGIVKTDTETEEVTIWEEKGHTPGEAIFIPWNKEDGVEEKEDAGILLTVVLDGQKGTSYLLCLNAEDLTELGRAEVPVAVGLGFHGRHLPY